MHEMKEKLIKAGTDILNASKTELYVSMRFLDIALSSLGYEMDLSMKTIGTDSQKIRFNPRYLIENYQNDSVLVNRAYLHMLLHCVFRHMFHNRDKDEDVWNLSCDIAVTAIIDQMNYRCIRLVVPDERQAMYDRLKSEMKVLTAEGIYKSLTKRPLTWLEMEAAKKQFVVDDHVFWDSELPRCSPRRFVNNDVLGPDSLVDHRVRLIYDRCHPHHQFHRYLCSSSLINQGICLCMDIHFLSNAEFDPAHLVIQFIAAQQCIRVLLFCHTCHLKTSEGHRLFRCIKENHDPYPGTVQIKSHFHQIIPILKRSDVSVFKIAFLQFIDK